ncbi:MAG: peptidylprolyl isomerase, partial [Burkholderiales bacterium]|nr:peptidylprolyl isomerase [Burkholderiales bacterium]
EDIRNEILLTRIREREVDNNIVVTEAEVEAELAQQSTREKQESEYRLQHILVLVPDQATPQQIEAKKVRVELAAQAIARGADFGQVAATYSESADGLSGGNLGWRTASRLPSLFVESLAAMKTGEVSPILKSSNGFHLFKLLETRNKAGAQIVPQTHVRHILLRQREGMADAELRQRLQVLKTRVDSGTDFGELARLQSEDGSAPNGGDLGWISAGETVPEFEQAMSELKPGEVSNPVQTPFGWHLIQVMERREGELAGDKQKLAVRQALRARKSDEAFQDWLRQIRDRAFVEDRLEEK